MKKLDFKLAPVLENQCKFHQEVTEFTGKVSQKATELQSLPVLLSGPERKTEGKKNVQTPNVATRKDNSSTTESQKEEGEQKFTMTLERNTEKPN